MAIPNFWRINEWCKASNGYAMANAQVFFLAQPANTSAFPPTPQVQLYSDPFGLTPIPQPLVADGYGFVYAYVAAGTYTMVVALSNVIQNVYADQSYGLSGASTAQISLQTNGIPNANQGLLNLVGAGDVTVNTNALGQTVIESTGTVIPGTGTGGYVVTAFSGVISAPNNDILTADGLGNAKDSGVLVSSLAPTANTALTGTTTIALANITNANGVLNATDFPGADIGAQVNNAIAALPAEGGTVLIPASATNYNFTTTIVIPRLVKVCGQSAFGTILNYTGTTGWAVIASDASAAGAYAPEGGLEDLTLRGQSASNLTGAIYIGGSDGVVAGSGTVNTSGTSVTSESGTGFSTGTWGDGTIIFINGVPYPIASVGSSSSITLSTSAGTQNGVSYFVVASPSTAINPSTNFGDHFNINRVRIFFNVSSGAGSFAVGVQWGTNAWSTTIFQSVISFCGVGMLFPYTVGSTSGECISVVNSLIGNNYQGLYAGCGAGGTDFHVTNCSFDYNTSWAIQIGYAANSSIMASFNGCHIEQTTNWLLNYGITTCSDCEFTGAAISSGYLISSGYQALSIIGCQLEAGLTGSGALFNGSGSPAVVIDGWANVTVNNVATYFDRLGNGTLAGNLGVIGSIAALGNELTVGAVGVPAIVYLSNTPGKSAVVTNATVFSTTAAGYYRVSGQVWPTTLSSGAWQIYPATTVTPNGATGAQTFAIGDVISIGTSYTVTASNPSQIFYLASGATIGISTVTQSGSNSGGVYSYIVTIERLG